MAEDVMGERIPIASDHAGFELKETLASTLAGLGFEVESLGTDSDGSTDYADYAHPLAARVSRGDARFVSGDEDVRILRAWLETPFEGGRHERRVAKIDRVESE